MSAATLPRWRRWVLQHTPAPLLREPFALWIALACLLSAAAQLAGLNEPSRITQLLPAWVAVAWNAELAVGGLLTLAGVLSNRARILVFGLTPLGFGCLAYSAIIIAAGGTRGLFAAVLTSSLGLACFVKSFVYTTASFRIDIANKDGR